MIRFIIKCFLKKDNQVRIYYERIQRAKNIKNAKSRIPEYLKDNNFAVELNYKLWVTKGARFKASTRCEEADTRYTRIVGWISSYLIIFSVLNICEIPFFTLPDNCASFLSIALSIIILVFSQFAYAKNFSVHSRNYHTCALEISSLYNKLRFNKMNNNIVPELIEQIANEYEQILMRYDNHLPIDLDMFKIEKTAYFKLSKYQTFLTKTRYFFLVQFVYYFCVYGLPLLYITICIIINIYKEKQYCLF